MKWVTRENANVDRIACPWLIKRFIDADVSEDIDSSPEGRRLSAIAHGFRLLHGLEDHKKIELKTPMYDALYAWCARDVAAASESV